MTARNSKKANKYPLFRIQYYEYEANVGMPVEMYKTPLNIDGVFEPFSTSGRLSLGYMLNLKRKPETLECLINIGLGIQFYVDDTQNFMARSFSKQPIFVYFRRELYKLNLGEIMVFYDLKSLFEHKILPKKVGKIYDEFGIKLSFGAPFQKTRDEKLISPCWVDMPLNRIVEAID